MSKELQPPVLSVSLVKNELPTVIKNELPESEIVEIGIDDILGSSESEEEIIPDVKDIGIVYHPVCEEAIKSEILESYHCESLKTQVLVNDENSAVRQADNITQRNKIGDTSDENVNKGTGQAVVETQVQRIEKQNSLKTGIKTKRKIKVIKAPVIPVEAHEYISLAKDKHVCNYCQHACNRLDNLKLHIKRMHREVTTMYQCPYCPYKHKDTTDIQLFQCNLREKKLKLKYNLTKHKKVKHKQMQDGLDLREKRYGCNKCYYRSDRNSHLKRHNLVHLKPEEIQYFYCYHCSYKAKQKERLKQHIFTQHFKNVRQGKRHQCGKCEYETYASTMLKYHKLTHLKPEEIQYFYCYHCSYKTKRRCDIIKHIFRHFKKEQVKFDCYICNFITPKRESIIKHIKNHSKV